MSEHTPGPWRAIFYGVLDNPDWEIWAANGQIADVGYPDNASQREANAHLIASAPTLLAALKECLEQLAHEGLDRVPAAIHAREAIRDASVSPKVATPQEGEH